MFVFIIFIGKCIEPPVFICYWHLAIFGLSTHFPPMIAIMTSSLMKPKKAITCLDVVVSKSVDEIVDDYKAQLKSNNSIYKVSKGCSLLKMFSQDAEDCVMKLDASCFGHSYRQVIKAYSNYPVFFCDQLQFQNGSDIADVDQQKKFVIPKIDKECQPNDFRTEFDKVLSEIHGEFSRMVEPLVDYFENKQFLQEQTFCVSLNNFLETTMVENICISQREMD